MKPLITERSGKCNLEICSKDVEGEVGHVLVDLDVGDLRIAGLRKTARDHCGRVERGQVSGREYARHLERAQLEHAAAAEGGRLEQGSAFRSVEAHAARWRRIRHEYSYLQRAYFLCWITQLYQ